MEPIEIKVDRSEFLDPTKIEKPLLSFKEFLYPELQQSGPESYKVSDLEPIYFTTDQRELIFSGKEILKRFQSLPDEIERTLNLQDGFALMDLSPKTFSERFPENFVACWKSAIRNIAGNELVPIIRAKGDSVVCYWHGLYAWRFESPYYRFAAE
ncbi:MAG: hypothetical protein WC087_00310 [Candidatus Paceibacterota bacterium]